MITPKNKETIIEIFERLALQRSYINTEIDEINISTCQKKGINCIHWKCPKVFYTRDDKAISPKLIPAQSFLAMINSFIDVNEQLNTTLRETISIKKGEK